MSLVYLNGKYVLPDEARISVYDRGFLFADAVYESIPVFKRYPFLWEKHLARLQHSLHAIGLDFNYTLNEWQTIFKTIIDSHETDDLALYIQITRGADDNRYFWPEKPLTPTVFVSAAPIQMKTKAMLSQGYKVILSDDIRWSRCDIKSTAWLSQMLSLQKTKKHHADEAILIRNGMAIEGIHSNLFIVKNNTVITTPIDQFVLSGTTRDVVVSLCHDNQIPIQENPITSEALFDADEIWLTGSIKMITPVLHIDNQSVGDGKPGTLWSTIIDLYIAKQQHMIEENHERFWL